MTTVPRWQSVAMTGEHGPVNDALCLKLANDEIAKLREELVVYGAQVENVLPYRADEILAALPATQAQLAAHLDVTLGTISVWLKRLRKRGMCFIGWYEPGQFNVVAVFVAGRGADSNIVSARRQFKQGKLVSRLNYVAPAPAQTEPVAPVPKQTPFSQLFI